MEAATAARKWGQLSLIRARGGSMQKAVSGERGLLNNRAMANKVRTLR